MEGLGGVGERGGGGGGGGGSSFGFGKGSSLFSRTRSDR